MEIRFQKVAYTLVLVSGLATLVGCDAGGSTVPNGLAPGTYTNSPPPAANPTSAPVPVPTPTSTPRPTTTPAPTATPAPTPPPPVGSASATVTWDAPTARLNGTSLSYGEIAAYKVSYGVSRGTYTYTVNVNKAATSYTLVGLAPNTTYYIVVTSIDTAGKESANSNVVLKTL